jgi:hypothetical protein
VSSLKPVAGVEPGAPASLLHFLAEEGVPYEVSRDAGRYGLYVQAGAGVDEPALLEKIERGSGPLVRLARWPSGARSALAITGDVDAITIQDFAHRLWEEHR